VTGRKQLQLQANREYFARDNENVHDKMKQSQKTDSHGKAT
jgi:hypothetical protein